MENDPGIKLRNAMLGSISKTMGQLGVDSLQIGTSVIDADKPDLPIEPLVGHGDPIMPSDVVFEYGSDGTPDFDPYVRDKPLFTEADRKKWYEDKTKPHTPIRILHYGLGQQEPWGPDFHITSMNMWGMVSGCSYRNDQDGWKRTYRKAGPVHIAHFDLLEKWRNIGVKVFLDLPRGHTAYFVDVCKILYFNGDIVKAATIETPYGDLHSNKVLKWDRKWLYKCGLRNKDRIPVPDDLPYCMNSLWTTTSAGIV